MDHTEITPTWATVELPILRAIVRADLDGADLDQAAASAIEHLEGRRLFQVLEALVDDGMLDVRFNRGDDQILGARIQRPLPKARRAVGQWPTADGLANALADAFEHAANAEEDADRKLSYRAAAQAVVTGVATTAITKIMGL